MTSEAQGIPERGVVEWLRTSCVLEVTAVATLIIVLLHANESWMLRIPVSSLCVAALLRRAWLLEPLVWWLLTLCLAVYYSLHWDLWLVNHKYMMTYWCLAVACSVSVNDPKAALATNARRLIGLCFGCATLWKASSPEFMSGDFFQFVFLTDTRFMNAAELVGGMSPEHSELNLQALRQLKSDPNLGESARLLGTPMIPIIATFMAYWTVAIEAALTLAFLWPPNHSLARVLRLASVRNVLLVVFLFTTFPIATVQGFAALLAIMGLAQSGREQRTWLGLYLAIFVLLPFCDLPFGRILQELALP